MIALLAWAALAQEPELPVDVAERSRASEAFSARRFDESWPIFLKYARRGHVASQFAVCASLFDGLGVDQDRADAALWCRLAATRGFDTAQWYLGEMYLAGMGVAADRSEAVRWLTASAEQGNTSSMVSLATTLAEGEGDDLVWAWTWAHLVARLDPVQSATTLRFVIDAQVTEAQRAEGQRRLAERLARWGAP